MAATRRRNRALWLGLAASTLLHILGITIIGNLRREAEESEAFRARLAIRPRFEPQRLVASRPRDLPHLDLKYLPSTAEPALPADEQVWRPPVPKIELPECPTALRLVEVAQRGEEPELAREVMPSPAEFGWSDTVGRGQAFDLLRIEDLARADAYRAAVLVDKSSRRRLRGFLNMTRVRVYGAGSAASSALDALARYMTDHTQLLVQLRPRIYDDFTSQELLKDPVHFLFEGGGLTAYSSDARTRFSDEERVMLGRYLREGGFLFVERSYRFLAEMADQIEETVGREARLMPIPVSHPIYHSYFEFDGGFPSEDGSVKARFARLEEVGPGSSRWDYPGRRRVDAVDEEETAPPVGLWGVEFGGELVAVLSDLGMFEQWSNSFDTADDSASSAGAPEQTDEGSEPFLMAATNVVVYALTRPRGVTTKRARPAWETTRPAVLVDDSGPGQLPGYAESESSEDKQPPVEWLELDGVAIDASMAMLPSPLGSALGEGGFRLTLDGGYALSIYDEEPNGLLLHNLTAGPLWVELQYRGKSDQLEVVLVGGEVTTVTFGLSRFAFFCKSAHAPAARDGVGGRLDAEFFRPGDRRDIQRLTRYL